MFHYLVITSLQALPLQTATVRGPIVLRNFTINIRQMCRSALGPSHELIFVDARFTFTNCLRAEAVSDKVSIVVKANFLTRVHS